MTPEQKLKALAYYVNASIVLDIHKPLRPFEEFAPVYMEYVDNDKLNPLTFTEWTF